MIQMAWFYWVLAAFVGYAGWRNLREQRWMHGGFWLVFAALTASGDFILSTKKGDNPLPAQIAGIGVILLALFALRMHRLPVEEAPESQRLASAKRLGHRIFIPALMIPLVTVVVVFVGEKLDFNGHKFFSHGSITLMGLALAGIIATFAAMLTARESGTTAMREGRRLLDTMGWAAVLPMILATLGGVFAASGVGETIATLTSSVIPVDNRLACMLAYGLGMVVFTMIMGNAFAAFPVMTAGIGLPLLVKMHGADPAIMGALGMLTGYCGTLLTPMAANFNLVPAALLELKDSNGVIRAQVPTAIPLLITNLILMSVLIFR